MKIKTMFITTESILSRSSWRRPISWNKLPIEMVNIPPAGHFQATPNLSCSLLFCDSHAPSIYILHGLRRLTVPFYSTKLCDLLKQFTFHSKFLTWTHAMWYQYLVFLKGFPFPWAIVVLCYFRCCFHFGFYKGFKKDVWPLVYP